MAWGTKSRHERGYDYAWTKVRDQVMERDEGLCQPCKRAERTTLAIAVDHIVSKANAQRMRWTRVQIDHPSNLQAICQPCHDEKTATEQGKKAPARQKKRPGADGWPV